MAKFYLTTAIPYVNGRPHIGHALEFVQTDVVARYHRLIGDEVRVVSGSDENGLKIVRAAEEHKLEPQELCDRNTSLFQLFTEKLAVRIDVWRRGTDQRYHWPGVNELWKRSQAAGDIYKKKYRGLYCVGCEDFYLPKDLRDGKCPEHLDKPELVEEENYFFRLSKYESQLRQLIRAGKLEVIPEERKNETLALINQGLEDFSISRSRERAKGWGIPVPGDESQVIYTWYDALAIYMTAVGFGYDQSQWKKWWPADIHFIGKGINRFHTIYWPAMLKSAGLPVPRSVVIHGYITSEGQKISKTLGNVVDPLAVVGRYGADSTRYYLLREIRPFSDGDFTLKRFEQVYQSDLANGLGNLVQRVAALAERHRLQIKPFKTTFLEAVDQEFRHGLESFQFNQVLEILWNIIRRQDKLINDSQLWELKGRDFEIKLIRVIEKIRQIGLLLQPFLPGTAARIQEIFRGPEIRAPKPLFPRLVKGN